MLIRITAPAIPARHFWLGLTVRFGWRPAEVADVSRLSALAGVARSRCAPHSRRPTLISWLAEAASGVEQIKTTAWVRSAKTLGRQDIRPTGLGSFCQIL